MRFRDPPAEDFEHGLFVCVIKRAELNSSREPVSTGIVLTNKPEKKGSDSTALVVLRNAVTLRSRSASIGIEDTSERY